MTRDRDESRFPRAVAPDAVAEMCSEVRRSSESSKSGTCTNLSGAILHGANFRGSEYDSRTVFPSGFDPELAGMVEKNES